MSSCRTCSPSLLSCNFLMSIPYGSSTGSHTLLPTPPRPIFWAGLSWISEKFNLDGVSILYQVVSISKDSIVIVIPPTSIQYML